MDAQTLNDSLEAARAPPCWLDRSPWVTHYAAQARASDPCVVVSGRLVLALGFWSNGCSRSSMYCGGFSRRTLNASRIFWRRASAPSPSLSISRFMPRVGARRWRPAHAASLRRALGFYVGAPRTMHPGPTPAVVLAAGRRGGYSSGEFAWGPIYSLREACAVCSQAHDEERADQFRPPLLSSFPGSASCHFLFPLLLALLLLLLLPPFPLPYRY